jgi:excisionase family DNA binding protein
MTTREVAEYLGISYNTVLRWASEGKLPSFRLANNALRFRRDEIDAWLEQQRQGRRPTALHVARG